MGSTTTMDRHQEAAWWLRVYQTTVRGIRSVGLPNSSKGKLSIKVPTLMDQARQMREKEKGR